MEQYSEFAFVYDELMDEVDYDSWVKYLEDIIDREGVKVKNVLELACGTGNITIPLAKKHYDIAGLDISYEMLGVAREKAEKDGLELVLLEQDITELDFDIEDLDCILCACDGFNYIIDDDDLRSVFQKTYKLLKDKGLFIFDISSYYKLSQVLGNNMYGENREDITYIWQNYFYEEDKYNKFEEEHQQRAYTQQEIFNHLKDTGFSEIKIYGDFTFEEPTNTSQRIFFVCKK